MRKVLPRSFFDRPTLLVARELLGKYLVRRDEDGAVRAYMITEVEAYDGFRDKASHASRGQTVRNTPMFGHPGHWYVYFVYGMYEMLNVVTREKEYPAAVLIRGVDGYSGPGKLTRALRITRKQNALPATRKNGLWVEDRGVVISPRQITRTPRIGVAYAGPVWSAKRWRFVLRNPVSPERRSTSSRSHLSKPRRDLRASFG